MKYFARLAAAGALAASLFGLTGCSQPCLDLAHKLCDCQETELAKEQCIQQADATYQKADQDAINASQEACAALVDTCDCHNLDTEAGKKACGLAR